MIEFLNASQNLPFTVALTLMVLIAFVEGMAFLFGVSLSNLVENSFFETGLGPEQPQLEASTFLGKVFSWFKIGQVPILILILMFLTIFGINGLICQIIFLKLLGQVLPPLPVSILSLIISFPTLNSLAKQMNKIMPKDETSAVSLDSFIGRITTITMGTAKWGYPAQAKVKDSFGKYHYLMVEPDNKDDIFTQGEEALIVKSDNKQFYVIKNTNQLIKN